MPNIASDAWIKCPYFLKQKEQEKNSLYCCPIFEHQNSTKLIFKTAKDKNEHLKNFCATGFYRGCPIAIAVRERLEINEEI